MKAWKFIFILSCFMLAVCLAACPEDDDELEFHTFYNAESGCDSSTFIYDIYGKETRVIEDSRKLYIVDDSCKLENTRVSGLDLYIDDNHIAKVRCGYTTDGQCRYFWTHPVDGRHIVISGSCSAGYTFQYHNEQLEPC